MKTYVASLNSQHLNFLVLLSSILSFSLVITAHTHYALSVHSGSSRVVSIQPEFFGAAACSRDDNVFSHEAIPLPRLPIR